MLLCRVYGGGGGQLSLRTAVAYCPEVTSSQSIATTAVAEHTNGELASTKCAYNGRILIAQDPRSAA